MRRLAVCLFMLIMIVTACTAKPAPASQPIFFVFRINPPALVELSSDFQPVHTTPLSFPPECSLLNLFPSSGGSFIAFELNCTFGQTVFLLDTNDDALKQAFSDSDSHFLAWTSDGQAVYLKVDSIGRPRILRVDINGRQNFVPITELTYDLAPLPGSRDFIFTFTRGLGYGSEMWLAQREGSVVQQVLADKDNILSFARWSPDGRQIAFIKFPDSQTPYPMGELWVSNRDGSSPRFLAKVDAGHGFAPAWSPDGTRLAFVFRKNPDDPRVEQVDDALVSNIYTANVETGAVNPLTKFQNAYVEAPVWSPDGNTLAVTVVLNDKMNVYITNVASGESRPVLVESVCCAGWYQK